MSNTSDEMTILFKSCGALANGVPFRPERLCQVPALARQAAAAMAEPFQADEPDLVVGIGQDGAVLAYELASLMNTRCAYTQDKGGVMTISRHFATAPGETALIVLSEVKTGTHVRQCVELLRALKLKIAGIACLVDFSGGTVGFRFPFRALVTLSHAY